MAKPWEMDWSGVAAPWEQDWTNADYAVSSPAPSRSIERMIGFDIPKYPETQTPEEQFGMGALARLRKGGLGLKSAVSGFMPGVEYTPKDVEEAKAIERYLEETGLSGGAGSMTADIALSAPTMAFGGIGPALRGARGATSGLMNMLTTPEDRGEAGLYGAFGQYGGEKAAAGLSRIASQPWAQEGVKELYEKGLRPTFAQAIGGTLKTAEEKLGSWPVVGGPITAARERALESFNLGSMKDILSDVSNATGADLTGVKLEVGAKGIKTVKDIVGKTYDNIAENTSAVIPSEFATTLDALKSDAAQQLPKEMAEQLDRLIDFHVVNRLKSGQQITGEEIKKIDEALSEKISNYASGDPDHRDMANVLGSVKSTMIDMFAEQNPDYANALKAVDMAYYKLATLGKASTSSVSNEMATPAQMLQTMRGKDKSSWRSGFATRQMPWSEWAGGAQQVLGNTYPDSGTAGRMLLADLASTGATGAISHLPEFLIARGAAQGAWSPYVQDMLVRAAMSEPDMYRRSVGKGLARLMPGIGMAGSSIMTGGR